MPISDPPDAKHRVVGRLAPSPTGALHLGNARTFILAWLSARSAAGHVVLRIEDIDSPRVKPWAIEQAIDDLRWLGLDWDEGPDIGGPHAPYLQTARAPHHEQAMERLIELDQVYPCTCTRRDIQEAASAPHETPHHETPHPETLDQSPLDGLPAAAQIERDGPIYSGRCSGWRRGDPLPADGSYCWRFRVPDQLLTVEDRLYGAAQLNPAIELGDFPVTRKNGQAAYQLAVVVDDAAMQVTEVVRGADLLPSCFRQQPLIDALGFARPNYLHVPLVTGTDGRRLAKRHGDTRLSHYREAGVAAESIVGWAACSVGLIDAPTPTRAADLLSGFTAARLRRGASMVEPSDLV